MVSEAKCTAVSGVWHPPQSSHAEPARFDIVDGQARVTAADGDASLTEGPAASLSISERVGKIPRRIVFPDGSAFETRDNEAIDRWLSTRHGWRAGLVHRLERFHPRLVLFVALVVVLCVGIYRYALPLAVEGAVAVTPPEAPRLMSQGVLSSLDQTTLSPTQLGEARRRKIESEFRGLADLTERGAAGFDLHFRSADTMGANAFALPDGTIVVTDDLIKLADNDDEILGVLAHEIGHVVHQHSLRGLYRAAGLTGLIMFIGGDIGSGVEEVLLQSSALSTLSYSRDQETDADRYSVELMARAGRDPAAMADLLEKIREVEGDDDDDSVFLSTHPATPQRIEDVRRHAAELEGR